MRESPRPAHRQPAHVTSLARRQRIAAAARPQASLARPACGGRGSIRPRARTMRRIDCAARANGFWSGPGAGLGTGLMGEFSALVQSCGALERGNLHEDNRVALVDALVGAGEIAATCIEDHQYARLIHRRHYDMIKIKCRYKFQRMKKNVAMRFQSNENTQIHTAAEDSTGSASRGMRHHGLKTPRKFIKNTGKSA